MSEARKHILDLAMELPEPERAALADEILASIDAASNPEVDAFWIAEAERRIDAYERGEVGASPAEEVFERLRARSVHED